MDIEKTTEDLMKLIDDASDPDLCSVQEAKDLYESLIDELRMRIEALGC